ncbi:MAG: ribonuclease III [Candidatus Aminicenantes bacterium]|nr:ribonuclease III [Candidatus Aminicenantes bacterium]
MGFLFRSKPAGNAPQLEKRLGHKFRDKDLLLRALTHSSYAFETKEDAEDNELLEFLGDSVVGLLAADFFFRKYPLADEGDLSKLKASASSTMALSAFARQVKLDRFLRLGRGEEKSGGRKKPTILAGAFEAVVGALYLDGGFEAARTFTRPLLEQAAKKIPAGGATINNSKSALQEFLQKNDLPAPRYTLVGEQGPDHRKEFVVEVGVQATVLARASGPSRKAAEQKAAAQALKKYLGRRIKSLTSETFLIDE